VTVLTAHAPAKVNLALYVGEPRRDGLHHLVTLIQPITLADELVLELAGDGHDEILCEGVEGPNLAAAALEAYRRGSGWHEPAVRITIRKRVPVAAGLGGGSADAAATLRLAAAAAGRPDDALVHDLAPALGSDVPALVAGARALVTGAGEHVELLPPGDGLGVLVIPSELRLSAAAVYAEADRLGLPRPAAELERLHEDLLAQLASADEVLPAWHVHNDLQAAARSLCPSIDGALAAAAETGAEHVLVAGSGPTVVGLFTGPAGPARAARAAEDVVATYPGAVAAVAAAPELAHVRVLT